VTGSDVLAAVLAVVDGDGVVVTLVVVEAAEPETTKTLLEPSLTNSSPLPES
jgi:hypothetical protein